MTRRCSHCSNNGHNSRTCPTRSSGVKLFGVRLTDGSIMKKSASMGNLSSSSSNPTSPPDPPPAYLSDDPSAHASSSAKRRKKGTPWTEEEHRLFLLGLQKLGKGDWRGIARNYVLSRTPTQVASHAQKFFIRQCSATRRKRRSSLFDMAPDTAAEPPEDHSNDPHCSLKLSLKPDSVEPIEASTSEILKENIKEETSKPMSDLPPIIPAFYPAYIPVPFPVWPSTIAQFEEPTSHVRVVKPIPILTKEPMNVDELVGMSKQLSLKDPDHNMERSPLSLRLLAEPSRQSAFHAGTPVIGSSGANRGGGGGGQV